jgi:hypothetical protein
MHRHLHASRVVVVDDAKPRAGNGQLCTCVASSGERVWLSLVDAGEHPAASQSVVTIPAE